MSKLDIVENEANIHDLVADWSRLCKVATPMQSPQWMLAWWNAHRAPQDRLTLIAVRDANDAVIGIVPWYRQSSAALGTTIRFLGSGRACSDHQTFLCQPGHENSVVREVVEWLSLRSRIGSSTTSPRSFAWELLDLEGVSVADNVMKLFVDTMAARGHITHHRPSESTWRIDLSGGWEGFLSRQSKTQRSQTRNFVNRFDKSADLRIRFASQEKSEVDRLLAALVDLHQKRWNAVGGDGCFADSRMKIFFQNAMREMIAIGSAEIVVLERDQRPVAAVGWLIQEGTVYAYQSGRDPAEDANRVGRIANSVAIRSACEQGFQALDFLRGDESYKSQMRAEPTASNRIRVVARASFPELRHKLWLACREVKARWQGAQHSSPAASHEIALSEPQQH